MIGNTSESWGWPARAFHWVIALMILALFGFGLWMADVPPRDQQPFYFGIHASIGITLLALMAARFLWWMVNVAPAAPEGTPAWRRTAAKISHRLLYTLTFATAVVGWLMSGTFKEPLQPKLFGLVPVPQFLEAGSPYNELLEETHEMLAFALIALVIVHTAAALYHHFVRRDRILLRMIVGAPKHGA
jgi:cytochrome b561